MKIFWKKYKLQIITISLMVVIGTCMHFVCDVFDNATAVKILGVIFPINETSWEHMKMLWYPFLAAGIILSVKEKDKGYLGGFVIGGIVAMLCMIGLFAFYQSFTTTSVLALDIPLFTLDMVLSAMLAFLLSKQKWCEKSGIVWIVVAVLVTALIIYLTYCPGKGYLFFDDEGLTK